MADTVEFLRQPQAITTNTIFNLYDALFMKCLVSVIQDAMGLKRFKKIYLLVHKLFSQKFGNHQDVFLANLRQAFVFFLVTLKPSHGSHFKIKLLQYEIMAQHQ